MAVRANRASLDTKWIIYLLLIVVPMFVSLIAKRELRCAALPGLKYIPRRCFSFSSKTWNKGYKHDFLPSGAVVALGSNVGIGETAYDISVAYSPKKRESLSSFRRQNREPSPAMKSPTGEDNLFVSKKLEDGSVAIGVADGVGGWAEAGYDSSAISRELCNFLQKRFEEHGSNSGLSPKDLLQDAFKDVLASDKVEIGGTTACLGILTPNYKLKVANLGDSWCGVFRNYELINETKFQTHNFNTPFQLAKIPHHIIKQAELQNRRYIIDSPNDADTYTWDLEKGDLILFATDGVTDNVVSEDIGRFLKDKFELNSSISLGDVSQALVDNVVRVSKDTNYPSSFAQELSKLTGLKYLGGKEDDITIILVRVK